MILYVNGDSHTAAAEAVNPYAFAEDDKNLIHLGRLPHPDNLAVSWGKRLSQPLKAVFKCDAESAASNSRIMRTTKAWLDQHTNDLNRILVIIQWSTWERQEWEYNGKFYQVNASGIDSVPNELQERYKQFVSSVDWKKATKHAHDEIWEFGRYLDTTGVKYLFFNGNNHFQDIPKKSRHKWDHRYIGPYDPKMTFSQWLLDHGHETVSPKSWHFGRDAHGAWCRFMLQYIIQNNMVS